METFCGNCGKEIPANVAFCTECGTKVPVAVAMTAPEAPKVAPIPQPQPTYIPPAQQQVPYAERSAVAPTGKYSVVGTGYFFGMMFLYAIPVLGWLICIISAFASKNENKKHFAKAIMIWLIIGIVLSVVGYFVFRWLGGMITDYINAEFGGQFGDLQELLEQFKQFESSGLLPTTN